MEASYRTGHEYYSEMPKPIRKRWSANRNSTNKKVSESDYLKSSYYDFRTFMLTSFNWKHSEEGSAYWVYVSYQNFNEANRLIKPKTSIRGTIAFLLILFLILGFYALIWTVFFKDTSPVKKLTNEKFVAVTVWEKPDTLDMILADKNYKGE